MVVVVVRRGEIQAVVLFAADTQTCASRRDSDVGIDDLHMRLPCLAAHEPLLPALGLECLAHRTFSCRPIRRKKDTRRHSSIDDSRLVHLHHFNVSMSAAGQKRKHTFIVEHLDPELEDWQALEYNCIFEESRHADSSFLLSGLTSSFDAAQKLQIPQSSKSQQSVEDRFPSPGGRQKVCLLDPKAERDLNPEDGELFDVFLFGGILGTC